MIKRCRAFYRKLVELFVIDEESKSYAELFDLPISIMKTIRKKRLKTKIFRYFTIACLGFCFLILAGLFGLNFKSAYKGLMITTISIPVDKNLIVNQNGNQNEHQKIPEFFYNFAMQNIFTITEGGVKKQIPITQKETNEVKKIISSFYDDKNVLDHAKCSGKYDENCILSLKVGESFDKYYKEVFKYKTQNQKINDIYNLVVASLSARQMISLTVNSWFFTNTDSRYSELAGIAVALRGTMYIIFIFVVFCVPLSIITALYIEEFAKKNWVTNLIEVNINNLAAVPSIIYGLFGLLLYVNYAHLPRSSSIVGGLTLSLLVMPVLITSCRSAIKNIPQMLREITFAMGASKSRVVFGVVLPAALPGILTGIILTLARLIGETAPLLIIGMVAFVGNVPSSMLSPATALPVQIYLWSSSPSYLLINKASLLILCLIFFLLIANYAINLIRQRFEIKSGH